MPKNRIGFSKDLTLVDGNIGIGTSNPSSILSVVSPSSGDNILQVIDNTPTGSMFRVNNSSGYPLMDIDSDGTILYLTTGNVGIGSNIYFPAYKVEIGGDVKAGTFYGNGSFTYSSHTTLSASTIGIGTTNPTSRFSIINPSTGDTVVQIGDNVNAGSMFRVNNSSGYPLMDIDGDGTILFLTPGNVSVGPSSISPAYKLEVGGDLRVGTASTQGIILTSPNGTRYRVTINDSGVLSSAAI